MAFVLPQVIPCGWQDVKIQLLTVAAAPVVVLIGVACAHDTRVEGLSGLVKKRKKKKKKKEQKSMSHFKVLS